jgi:GNAT superfamily N-acetyltransferase
MFAAFVGGERVGGAIVLRDAPRLTLLGGRRDLALLWDLRVAPSRRGHGIGGALFGAAERWAVAEGCSGLLIETQDVNVPASRFYARQGCVLGAARFGAYADCPNEVQLLWYKRLSNSG